MPRYYIKVRSVAKYKYIGVDNAGNGIFLLRYFNYLIQKMADYFLETWPALLVMSIKLP